MKLLLRISLKESFYLKIDYLLLVYLSTFFYEIYLANKREIKILSF